MNPETTIPVPNHKVNLLINQFRRENESWRRTLAFLIEEDIVLKTGISEILKNMTYSDGNILKRLEHFHNRLIKENDTVRLLKTGVTDMEKKLNQDFYPDPDFTKNIIPVQGLLRKEIETAEMEFHKLKCDLNAYIEGILQNGS